MKPWNNVVNMCFVFKPLHPTRLQEKPIKALTCIKISSAITRCHFKINIYALQGSKCNYFRSVTQAHLSSASPLLQESLTVKTATRISENMSCLWEKVEMDTKCQNHHTPHFWECWFFFLEENKSIVLHKNKSSLLKELKQKQINKLVWSASVT